MESAQKYGCDRRGCAVGAIDDHIDACEPESGNAVNQELNVIGLEGGIVVDRRESLRIGDFDLRRMVQDLVLHSQLGRIGEFEPVAAKELDAVILPRIMRSGDYDAGLKTMSAGEKCNCRSGDDSCALDIRSRFPEACGESGRDPWARFARIAPQNHLGLRRNFVQRMSEGEADTVD